MGQRYYFKLRKPIDELCQIRGKAIPTRDALSGLATFGSFRKEEFSEIFESERHAFSDGMLEALSNWLDLEPHDFVSVTFEEPRHIREAAFDSFRLGWDGILHSMTNNREFISHERSYLTSEREVRRAIEEWQIELGWQLLRQGVRQPGVDKERFLEVAMRHLQLKSESELPDKVVSWWRVNDRISMSAYDLTEKRCGISCLIPLEGEAYEEICGGRLSALDIRPEHIRNNSPNAILFGATDFSYRMAPKHWIASTRAVIGCLLAQLALCAPEGNEAEIKVLGISSTNASYARLESCSFRALEGSRCNGSHASLCELVANNCDSRSILKAIQKARNWSENPRKRRSRIRSKTHK